MYVTDWVAKGWIRKSKPPKRAGQKCRSSRRGKAYLVVPFEDECCEAFISPQKERI
jgi:hypothetical protein